MAKSGYLAGTCTGSSGSLYTFRLEWMSISSYESNSSSLAIKLYIQRNDGYSNSAYNLDTKPTVTLKVGGVTLSPTTYHIDTREGKKCQFAGVTTDVKHNDDGTLTVPVSASFTHSGSSSLTGGSLQGNITIDTIPRASTITSASDRTLGGSCIVKWTPQSAAFRYKLKFSMGSWSTTTDVIHPNTKTAYTYTGLPLPLDLAEQIPNSSTGTVTVTLYTYYDSAATKWVSPVSSKTFKVIVPDNTSTKPLFKMTLAPVSSLGSAFEGLYIQGKSRVKATFSGSGRYGATIASYGLTVLGKGYASPFQTELIATSGTVEINGRAKDSRGFIGYISQNIDVIPYSKPLLSKGTATGGGTVLRCARCDESGSLSKTGTFLRITAGRSYSRVWSGDVQKNFCAVRYRYKTTGASSFSSWTTLLSKTDMSTDSVDVILGNIVSSTTTSYIVELGVIDDVGGENGSSSITFSIPTDAVTFHLREGGDGAAFGKYAELDKTLDIASDWGMRYKGNDIENKFYSLRGNATIPSGGDLNDYRTPNVYAIAADAHAANIANMPPFKRAGLLIVYAGTGQETVGEGTWKYIVQEYKCLYSTIPVYRRTISSDGEGTWTFETWQMEKGLDTGWVELTKSAHASAPSTVARGGAGCFYRVINENHVFVRFNCAFTFGGSSVNLNSATIPSHYRPKNNAYALCPVNDRGIARASVATDGYIYVNYVQNMATASTTTSFEVTWIDGYIDYWL